MDDISDALPNLPPMSKDDFIKTVEDALSANINPKTIGGEIDTQESIINDWAQRRNVPLSGSYRRHLAEKIEKLRHKLEESDT